MADLADVERELDRVVTRLTSLPLGRAGLAQEDCLVAARLLVAAARDLGDPIPADAVLPRVGPQALGSLLAVVGNDYLTAARASSDPDLDPVLDALVALRRSLP